MRVRVELEVVQAVVLVVENRVDLADFTKPYHYRIDLETSDAAAGWSGGSALAASDKISSIEALRGVQVQQQQ